MDEQLLSEIRDVLREYLPIIAEELTRMRERVVRPTATIERPASCLKYKAEDCARLNDEAAIELGRGADITYMCRGCGESVTVG